jgi:hypothetical protein
MKHSLVRLVFIFLMAAQAAPHTAWAQVKTAPPLSGVKGKLQSFTGTSLEILTQSGVVHINIKQPLTTYKQIPSDLSHVTSTSFVGPFHASSTWSAISAHGDTDSFAHRRLTGK